MRRVVCLPWSAAYRKPAVLQSHHHPSQIHEVDPAETATGVPSDSIFRTPSGRHDYAAILCHLTGPFLRSSHQLNFPVVWELLGLVFIAEPVPYDSS